MCTELNEAIDRAIGNIQIIAEQINSLKIPNRYKGAFMMMSDNRGFRYTNDTLSQMEIIGSTDSDICFILIEGKEVSLIGLYHFAVELENDKQRAKAVEILRTNKSKSFKESDILKAILSVKSYATKKCKD